MDTVALVQVKETIVESAFRTFSRPRQLPESVAVSDAGPVRSEDKLERLPTPFLATLSVTGL